jgi:Ca2+-binding RTX toxin-like protein
VVRGTVPAGETITVDVFNGEGKSLVVDLDEVADADDGLIVSGTVFRWLLVSDAAGATGVRFDCTMDQQPADAQPPATCTAVNAAAGDGHAAQPHVDANFAANQANRTAFVTITLTFGGCDGRPGTVFLGKEDTPTAGNDVIIGTPGNDTVNGLGGNDVICGRGGKDTLRGGDGRDRVYGENGNDRLEGGAKGDWLYGGAGNETMLGQAGNDALDGGANSDTCNGGTERDTGVRCEVRNGIP